MLYSLCYILYYTGHWPNRVFAIGPGDLLQSQVESYKRLKKMVLDATLLNTQHYKIRIKVKLSNPGNGVAPSPTLGVVAIEKGAFGSPTTTVANNNLYEVCLKSNGTG